MSITDLFVGELLNWAPMKTIPQIVLAFAICILIYPSIAGLGANFLFIIIFLSFTFVIWGMYSYYLRGVFNNALWKNKKEYSENLLSLTKDIIEGNRSLVGGIKSYLWPSGHLSKENWKAIKRPLGFMGKSIIGIISFYGILIATLFGLNATYLVISSFDLLARLGIDGMGVAAFLVIIAFVISFMMQVRRMEFQPIRPDASIPISEKELSTNIIRRYLLEDDMRWSGRAAPILRGLFPLTSIPTLEKPVNIAIITGIYEFKNFLDIIKEGVKDKIIESLDSQEYDKLITVHEHKAALTNISALTQEQLFEVIFSTDKNQHKGMNIPK